MIKKYLTVGLLGSCIATSSYALNFVDMIHAAHKDALSSLPKKVESSASIDKNYTDFSGTWTGQCSLPYNPTVTWVIYNNDQHIIIDDKEINIGAFNNESTSNGEEAIDDLSRFSWSSHGLLKMLEVLVVRSKDNASIQSSTFQTTFELNNGQLIVETIAYKDRPDNRTLEWTCTLNLVK